MSKRNGLILALLFVILVVEILIFAPIELGLSPADEMLSQESQTAIPTSAESSQVIHKVHSFGAKGDVVEWELWADRALGPRNNTEEWTIQNVRVKFYASNGVIYHVTGRKGLVAPVRDDLRIEGAVTTKSSNGYTFKSESIFYDSKNRQLTSPENIQMTGPPDRNGGPLRLTGADMVADFVTNQIRIGRQVRASKTVHDDKAVTIQSQRAVFSGRSNTAQFLGNVVIDVNTMRITGPEARFSYDRRGESFESVEVGGGVRVTDTDKFATSKSVSVQFKEDQVIFNGGPRVVKNGDELVGEQIIFLDGGRKIQVSKARAQMDSRTMQSPNQNSMENKN
jgi:LPS export ABC transporter protein LptC